jgi:hypothetical protein
MHFFIALIKVEGAATKEEKKNCKIIIEKKNIFDEMRAVRHKDK